MENEQTEIVNLESRLIDPTVNRTAQGLTWTDPQRRAVAVQFKKNHPEPTQPVDRLLKEAQEQVLPRQLWRKWFSGNDPVKRMIHEMQGTKPVKDFLKSQAAKRGAITRRLGKRNKTESYSELLTPDEIKLIRPRLKRWQCPECAIGRDTKDGQPFVNIRKNSGSLGTHRFKKHTAKGKAVARRAGYNFRPNRVGRPRKGYKPWGRKEERTALLQQEGLNRMVENNKHDPFESEGHTPQRKGRPVNFCPHCGWDIEETRKVDEKGG